MDFTDPSSASSKSKPKWTYDVFISFGEDIRRNFVSHLYSALVQAQVKTFLDGENLQKGMEPQELTEAIQGSRIAIVVFSKTYIESTRCLDELAKIIETRETHGLNVKSVFYEIDASVVRRKTDDFGKALRAAAEQRFSEKEVESGLSRWSCALTEAANISGLCVTRSSCLDEHENIIESHGIRGLGAAAVIIFLIHRWLKRMKRRTKAADCIILRSDAEVVEKIVKDVVNQLEREALSITKFPVGLESHVENVIGFIKNQSSKVCIIGIWGMAGSGKTTFAKAIYNRIHGCPGFEDKSFIEDIRDVCKNDGREHVHLQEQLLSDVLKTKVELQSVGKGRTVIKGRLGRKRLLIVLDNVNQFGQLKDLCGNREWFGPGTVIIITTRNLRLLNLLKVDYFYKMEEMKESESLELFKWHAFGKAKPRDDLNELARNVVAYCGGLPLALEVIGSYLCDKEKKEWERVLSTLEITPNDQVQEKLRTSFDDLQDQMEKDIFLDICCFFIGKDRAYVTDILNGCGLHADIGITILIECSLIKVENNNKLGMHPLLQEMGREIIRKNSRKEPGKCSRLWSHDDVVEVLRNKTGTEAVKGLALKFDSTNEGCFNTDAFKGMKSLRLLRLAHVQVTGDYEYLSKQLRWICWQGFPLGYIPKDLYLEDVIGIDLEHSKLKQVWQEAKVLQHLKILNLSHSKYLRETPDFSKLPSLEKLILEHCSSLWKIHQTIGDLRNLLLINLKDCTNLSNLPRETYKLKSLKTLILSGCLKIDKLEEDILEMESLTTLITENTVVEQVPFSIVSSKRIGYICLHTHKGLSLDVFHSIIWSWMSPTINPLSYIRPFCGKSPSLLSMNMKRKHLGDLGPILSNLLNLRSVSVQCDQEFQMSNPLSTIMDGVYPVNLTELETKSDTFEISKQSWEYDLVGIGSYQEVFSTLNKNIYETLPTRWPWEVLLPRDNRPYWFAHMSSQGHSVSFTVPKDCHLKGMIMCVVYLSTSETRASECLLSVLMVNYTKSTVHIYKRDTVISFNEVDWQGMISHMGSGDQVEIFMNFRHGLVVKRTAVYLVCDESSDMEIEKVYSRKRKRMETEYYSRKRKRMETEYYSRKRKRMETEY